MNSCTRCLRELPPKAGSATLYCRRCRAEVRREQKRLWYRRWAARRRCSECGGRLTRYSRGGYCARCLRAAAERIASIDSLLRNSLEC